jgi:hypothetical protein
VDVRLDGCGLPQLVTETADDGPRRATTAPDSRPWTKAADDGHRKVEVIGEVWRVDDEWWRQPITRRYVEVVLEGGAHTMLFQDLATGDWFEQWV